jgi:hypothetical protein
MKEEKDRLLKKWEPFLEGIVNEYTVENTAILLENEARYLTEAPVGSTGQSDVQGLQKIMLPIVRRVFPNLIANNIISVQPISQPSGIIFYLKYQMGTDRPGNPQGVNGHTYTGNDYPEFSMYENTAGAMEGYNPWYTSDEIGPFVGVGGTSAPVVAADVISVNPLVVPPRTYNGPRDVSGKAPIQNIFPMQSYQAGLYVDAAPVLFGTIELTGDNDYSETFSFSSATGTAWVVNSISNGGFVATTTSDFTVTYDGAAQTVAINYVGTVVSNPVVAVKAWYKTNLEFQTNIPEMRITIGNIPVIVKSRKLKAMWSQESEQDLKAYHGLSADAELTALVSNEMIAEIDREIIQVALRIVPQSSRYTYHWNNFQGNNVVGNYLDTHVALMQVVTRASNEVFRKSKIGPANWMIMGTELSSYVEMLKGFIPNPVTASMGLNIVKAGTFQGKFDIYKDPMFPGDKILMGHKSPQTPFGAGLVYSPYVTNLTPVIVGQDDFNPRRGFLARYGLTKVPFGEQLFAMVNVKGLPSI